VRWCDVRAAHPDQWLVIEALEAHSVGGRRVFDQIAVVEVCPDGRTSMKRYAALHREHPERELGFAHTGMVNLDIEERPWMDFLRAASAIIDLRQLRLDLLA
jgi:hypothetical protein